MASNMRLQRHHEKRNRGSAHRSSRARLPRAVRSGAAQPAAVRRCSGRSEDHTSELQSLRHLVCPLLLSVFLFPYTTLFRSVRLWVSASVRPYCDRAWPWHRTCDFNAIMRNVTAVLLIAAAALACRGRSGPAQRNQQQYDVVQEDRKTTRLNSSHLGISYALCFYPFSSFPTRRSSDLFVFG